MKKHSIIKSNRVLTLLVGLLAVVLSLGADWTPDRRPIQIIWTGPAQWTPAEVATHLPGRLADESLTDDPRGPRFMIHSPASWTGDHQMAQFWTLPKATRTAYQKAMVEACKIRKCTFGITCHLQMSGPFSRSGPYRYFDFYDPGDFYGMWGLTIEPWHKLLGAGSLPGPGLFEWGMEGGATTDGWATAEPLARWLRDEQGIHSLVEGVPMLNGQVDVARCQETPAWCLAASFADNPALLGGQSVAGCPECHALLVATPYFEPTETVRQIRSLLDRGWIVGGDQPHTARIKEAMSQP